MSSLSPLSPATLDEQALAELRALDPTGRNQLLVRVVRAFESSTGRLVPQLTQALAQGDHATIRQVAHTLKSSSASVGARDLSRTCAELEARIREGQVHDLAPAVAVLVGHIEAARAALRDVIGADA